MYIIKVINGSFPSQLFFLATTFSIESPSEETHILIFSGQLHGNF